MKYKPRKKIFEGSNCSFDPALKQAFSYGWWPMLYEINGLVVRNTFNYSPSTCKHQYKLNACLDSIGLKPDITISVRADIRNTSAVKADMLATWAELAVKTKYSTKGDWTAVAAYEDTMNEVSVIGVRFNHGELAEALDKAEEKRRKRLDSRRTKKRPERPKLTLVS
jgi:hypothetical protein